MGKVLVTVAGSQGGRTDPSAPGAGGRAVRNRSGSPGMQMQWKTPIWSRQVASFWQGLEEHSFTSISQRGPE